MTLMTAQKLSLLTIANIAVAMLVSACLHAWGIMGDLPFRGENEEGCFIESAINIALFGDLNPHEFINPGSTLIYPLALVYKILDATLFAGKFFFGPGGVPHTIWDYIYFNPVRFHLPARLISVAYSVLSIPIFYLLCRQAAGKTAASFGVWLFALSPLIVENAHLGRTDSAALFFSMLCLLFCLRASAPEKANVNALLAGASWGLAVSSRYFMVSLLVPVLVTFRRDLRASAKALISALCAFAITSPYFFLDIGTAVKDITFEASSTMVGADGLSPLGNLWYYLSDAFPYGLGWVQIIAIVFSSCLLVIHCKTELAGSTGKEALRSVIILTSFFVATLAGVCLNARHWPRWVIPMLPPLYILTAFAIAWVKKRTSSSFIGVALALACLGQPLLQIVQKDMMLSIPSTQVEAAKWIEDNLDAGTGIAQDVDMVRLNVTRFKVLNDIWRPDFINRPHQFNSPDDCASNGYTYMVTNDLRHLYLESPQRFPREAKFYEALEKTPVVAEFVPRTEEIGIFKVKQRGGVVRIHRLK